MTEVINIPLPKVWTVEMANMLADLSAEKELPYVWSAAEMGGMAFCWQRPTQVISKQEPPTFTLIIQNTGQVLFFKERNGFGAADGFELQRDTVEDMVSQVISEVEAGL